MALKCAKNDFKHSTVHGDRRSEKFGVIFDGQILNENFSRMLTNAARGKKHTQHVRNPQLKFQPDPSKWHLNFLKN